MAEFECKTALREVLKLVERPGTFATGGETSPFFPELQVKTMGRIGLPLCHSQVMELKSRCEQAPYGRREETIVDTSVRNAWQLDASRLTIGATIKKAVTSLIPQLSNDLGCQGVAIKALPYKLVLYEKGGFFLPHRDTEKAPGMFATLVVQLPAEHKGGELVVQHNGEEKIFDFATKSAAKIFFAAFFADCRHELRPVTSGLRLCLIYNLVHSGSEPTPPADRRQAVDRITQAVKSWIADDNAPTKLICVLQHQYTQAGLSFNGLKNRDRAVAQVLCMAAQESELDVHLAILTKRDSGSAEENYGRSFKKRRGHQNPKNWSMSDDFESTVTLNNWVGSDNQRKDFGEMFVDEESEFLAVCPFDNLKPDGIEVEECSGNEGASMERWYNLAALVLWPSANKLALKLDARSQYGMDNAAKKLQKDIAACREKGLAANSKEWQECQEMTQLMVKRMKKQGSGYYVRGASAVMLSNIQSSGDLQLYSTYLEVLSKNSFSAEIASSLLCGCQHYGWPALHDGLCAMLQHNSKNSKLLSECVSLVAALAAEGGPTVIADEQQLHTCRELAAVVHAAVIGCSTEAVPVAALFKVLYVVDQPQLLQEAARHVKSRPEQYKVVEPSPLAAWYYMSRPVRDNSLVAAMHELSGWLGAKAQECSPFVELLEVCIATLAAKTNVVAIPDTWAVKFSFMLCCKDCRDLVQFLSHSSQEVGRFKVASARRSHLQQRLVGVNALCVLERNSQTLVVTKTRPQLQRQREQLARDLQALAKLRALPAAASITAKMNGATAIPTTSHPL